MRDSYGLRVLTVLDRWRRQRRPRVIDKLRPRSLRLLLVDRWVIIVYRPWAGWWARSAGTVRAGLYKPLIICPEPKVISMKRLKSQHGEAIILPMLSCDPSFWKDLPNVVDFYHATSYEDGEPRVPGYITLRNKLFCSEVTLYDPDSGSRLVCRAPSLKEALKLADKLLATPDVPWEPDAWLLEQLAKRPKSKKKLLDKGSDGK